MTPAADTSHLTPRASRPVKVITDLGVAAKMAESAVKGAMLNVEVNLASIKDEDYKQEVLKEAEEFSCPDSLAKMIVSKVEAHLR